MNASAHPAWHPFLFRKDDISLIILLITLVSFTAGLTALVYPLLLLVAVIWVRTFTLKEAVLLICFLFVLSIISVVNVAVIGNYWDLTWKGVYKLLLFAISAIAYRKLFCSVALKNLSKLRLAIWLSFLASLLINTGFDLQSMQQMLILNILFMVEFYAFIRGDTRLLFYFVVFILFITTKKQLWFSAFIFILLIQPRFLKGFLALLLPALFFVAFFGAVGGDKAGITAEERASSALTERFVTPDPYGNMRLYLMVTLIPKLIEHDIVWGYGMERYGTIAAYESHRDIERSELDMSDFIPVEYNPTSLFGSVAADVGFLTIMMQMGLAGIVLYFFLLWILAREVSTLVKGLGIILPYFLGGPIVYSVGLPIFLGLIYAMLALHKDHIENGDKRLRPLTLGRFFNLKK